MAVAEQARANRTARGDGFSEERQKLFLAALRTLGDSARRP